MKLFKLRWWLKKDLAKGLGLSNLNPNEVLLRPRSHGKTTSFKKMIKFWKKDLSKGLGIPEKELFGIDYGIDNQPHFIRGLQSGGIVSERFMNRLIEQENSEQNHGDCIGSMQQAMIEASRRWGHSPISIIMDRKYPHQCFKCNAVIYYNHALEQACIKYNILTKRDSNVPTKGYSYEMRVYRKSFEFHKQFNKWWKDTRIQFYCCNCYQKEVAKNGRI